MKTPKQYLKSVIKTFSYLLFLSIVTMLGLELCYRTYVIDFYSTQFEFLNQSILPAEDNPPNAKRILVLGDSFTADPKSYVQLLRDSIKNAVIFNSGVPGTSVKEAGLMLKRRLKQTNPTAIVYQIYVGNDLLDFRHPYRGNGLTLLRKTYWWLSDKIWVLSYISRQLPYVRQSLINDLPTSFDSSSITQFNSQTYSSRTKLYCQIEPNYLQNTILLKGDQAGYFEKYCNHLRQFVEAIPSTIPVYVLVIPHCIQIGHKYVDRMNKIGCYGDSTQLPTAYPFIEQLKSNFSSVANVSIINALPQLTKFDLIEEVYYGNDPHLNEIGQGVIGQLLLNQIDNGK